VGYFPFFVMCWRQRGPLLGTLLGQTSCGVNKVGVNKGHTSGKCGVVKGGKKWLIREETY